MFDIRLTTSSCVIRRNFCRYILFPPAGDHCALGYSQHIIATLAASPHVVTASRKLPERSIQAAAWGPSLFAVICSSSSIVAEDGKPSSGDDEEEECDGVMRGWGRCVLAALNQGGAACFETEVQFIFEVIHCLATKKWVVHPLNPFLPKMAIRRVTEYRSSECVCNMPKKRFPSRGVEESGRLLRPDSTSFR